MNPSAAPYRLCEFKQALVSSQKVEQKSLPDGLVTMFIIKIPGKCYLHKLHCFHSYLGHYQFFHTPKSQSSTSNTLMVLEPSPPSLQVLMQVPLPQTSQRTDPRTHLSLKQCGYYPPCCSSSFWPTKGLPALLETHQSHHV